MTVCSFLAGFFLLLVSAMGQRTSAQVMSGTAQNENLNSPQAGVQIAWSESTTEVLTQERNGVPTEEEQAVRKMLTERREAFNRHDVKAGCSYFADDADFVSVTGSWWKGKEKIEDHLELLYATRFRDIHFNDSEITIRFITPEVAVAHFRWEATGIVGADRSPRPSRQGISTILAVKHNGKWLVEVANNNEFFASIRSRLSR